MLLSMIQPLHEKYQRTTNENSKRGIENGSNLVSYNSNRQVVHAHKARLVLITLALLSGTFSVISSSSHDKSTSLRRTDRFLQECVGVTEECCKLFVPECEEASSSNPLADVPFGIQIILIIVLIFLSAAFSGLTLGLMSLDMTGLEIVMSGDDPKQADYARKIFPVRKNGNRLLCTLLLGNVAVNSLLSILMADKAGGILGFILSTGLIVVFGEILPQALCSRYPLEIGSRSVTLVRVIMAIVSPIAFPLAWMLNFILGKELATTYTNAEMLKLLQIHVQEDALDHETAVAMTGALQYKNRLVKDVMTQAKNTFMLSSDDKLDFETIAKIFKTGYSRIPVYEISRNNVIGLLFVKDLIFIDPEDGTRVSDFVQIFGRGLHVVWPDDKLGDVLRELKQGKSHMALVRDVNNEDDGQDPYYEIVGIITLEDILEEILGEEIVDETDAFVDGTHLTPVDRAETFKWARLRLLDSKLVDETLSIDECKAVVAHLRNNYTKTVDLLTDNQLCRLIANTSVTLFPTAVQVVGQAMPKDLLYEKGKNSDQCILVLSGKVTVLVGGDNFRSDISSWSLLGSGALLESSYKPDFSAFVSAGPCRCLTIKRDAFNEAVDNSTIERQSPNEKGTLSTTSSDNSLTDTQSSLIPVDSTTDSETRKSMLMSALHMVKGENGESAKRVLSKTGSDIKSTSESAATNTRASIMAKKKKDGAETSRTFDYINSPHHDDDDADGDADNQKK